MIHKSQAKVDLVKKEVAQKIFMQAEQSYLFQKD